MGWYPNPKIVIVSWNDATNLATWHDKEEIEEHFKSKPYECTNVGYLIYEDTDCVIVAARKGSFNEKEDAWGLIERLPKGIVVSISELPAPVGVNLMPSKKKLVPIYELEENERGMIRLLGRHLDPNEGNQPLDNSSRMAVVRYLATLYDILGRDDAR